MKKIIKILYRKYCLAEDQAIERRQAEVDLNKRIASAYIGGVQREFINLGEMTPAQEKTFRSDVKSILDTPAFQIIVNDLLKGYLEKISVASKSLDEEKDARLGMRYILYFEDTFKAHAEETIQKDNEDNL